jgi:hypothetical protein
MSSSTVSTRMILDSPSDWDSWFYLVKSMSTTSGRDAWRYINPDLPTEPQLPEIPEDPSPESIAPTKQTVAQLDKGELERYEFLYQDVQYAAARVTETLEIIGRVHEYINSSVSSRNLVYVRNKTTVYQILLALKKRLAPTDDARKFQLTAQYNQLKKFQKNESVEHWLQSWERTYEDAVLQHSVITGDQPLFDFVNAIRPIDTYFASILEYHIEEKLRQGQPVDIYDLIENFRTHHRRFGAQKKLESESGSGSQSAVATFKNQTQDKKKICLCGGAHLHRECFYLNSETRPRNWRGRPEIYARINEKLNQKNMEGLKRALWKQHKYDATIPKASV